MDKQTTKNLKTKKQKKKEAKQNKSRYTLKKYAHAPKAFWTLNLLLILKTQILCVFSLYLIRKLQL